MWELSYFTDALKTTVCVPILCCLLLMTQRVSDRWLLHQDLVVHLFSKIMVDKERMAMPSCESHLYCELWVWRGGRGS